MRCDVMENIMGLPHWWPMFGDASLTTCNGCKRLRVNQKYVCRVCEVVGYCTRRCQQNDWDAGHQYRCHPAYKATTSGGVWLPSELWTHIFVLATQNNDQWHETLAIMVQVGWWRRVCKQWDRAVTNEVWLRAFENAHRLSGFKKFDNMLHEWKLTCVFKQRSISACGQDFRKSWSFAYKINAIFEKHVQGPFEPVKLHHSELIYQFIHAMDNAIHQWVAYTNRETKDPLDHRVAQFGRGLWFSYISSLWYNNNDLNKRRKLMHSFVHSRAGMSLYERLRSCLRAHPRGFNSLRYLMIHFPAMIDEWMIQVRSYGEIISAGMHRVHLVNTVLMCLVDPHLYIPKKYYDI